MTSEKDPCFRFASTQHLTTGQAEVLLDAAGTTGRLEALVLQGCSPVLKRATLTREKLVFLLEACKLWGKWNKTEEFKKSLNCKGLNWSF